MQRRHPDQTGFEPSAVINFFRKLQKAAHAERIVLHDFMFAELSAYPDAIATMRRNFRSVLSAGGNEYDAAVSFVVWRTQQAIDARRETGRGITDEELRWINVRVDLARSLLDKMQVLRAETDGRLAQISLSAGGLPFDEDEARMQAEIVARGTTKVIVIDSQQREIRYEYIRTPKHRVADSSKLPHDERTLYYIRANLPDPQPIYRWPEGRHAVYIDEYPVPLPHSFRFAFGDDADELRVGNGIIVGRPFRKVRKQLVDYVSFDEAGFHDPTIALKAVGELVTFTGREPIEADIGFINWLHEEQGYTNVSKLKGGRYKAEKSCLRSDKVSIVTGRMHNRAPADEAWTYATSMDAFRARHDWDGTGEPQGWISREMPE